MELCETCKNNNCSKKIIIKEESKIKTIKCLEYEKDKDKIKGYIKPKEKTAKQKRVLWDCTTQVGIKKEGD